MMFWWLPTATGRVTTKIPPSLHTYQNGDRIMAKLLNV